MENVATEYAVAPTTTSETDEELREAFEAVEQEKEAVEGAQEKTKEVEEDVSSCFQLLNQIHLVLVILF